MEIEVEGKKENICIQYCTSYIVLLNTIGYLLAMSTHVFPQAPVSQKWTWWGGYEVQVDRPIARLLQFYVVVYSL